MDQFRLEFTIKGNQDNPKANPVPYTRANRGGSWSPPVVRYHAWCNYVREAFLDGCQAWYPGKREIEVGNVAVIRPYALSHKERPISILVDPTKIHVTMSTDITFRLTKAGKAGNHGDADNILKGILDSLFSEDKAVGEGHFHTEYGDSGHVEVSLLIQPGG